MVGLAGPQSQLKVHLHGLFDLQNSYEFCIEEIVYLKVQARADKLSLLHKFNSLYYYIRVQMHEILIKFFIENIGFGSGFCLS
jgi:hypothetical protein